MYFLGMDVFLPQRRLERAERRKKKQEKESGAGVWGVSELIRLMAFVTHQMSRFSLFCLSSQAERSVYMMWSYEQETKMTKQVIAQRMIGQ